MYFNDTIMGQTCEKLMNKIEGLSDRDSIIIIAAYIDEYLCRILRDRLIHDGKKQTWFESADFGYMNRVRLAIAVGAIGKTRFKELSFIGNIRNKFAHHPDNDTLESDKTNDIYLEHYKYAESTINIAGFEIDGRSRYKIYLCSVAACINSIVVERIALTFDVDRFG